MAYYRPFARARRPNGSPLSPDFYRKNYELLPIVGIVACAFAGAVLVGVSLALKDEDGSFGRRPELGRLYAEMRTAKRSVEESG